MYVYFPKNNEKPQCFQCFGKCTWCAHQCLGPTKRDYCHMLNPFISMAPIRRKNIRTGAIKLEKVHIFSNSNNNDVVLDGSNSILIRS